jgi:hypothetical protein
MGQREVEPSPAAISIIGGALYLIIIVVGLFGEAYVRNRLVVFDGSTFAPSQLAGHARAIDGRRGAFDLHRHPLA